MGRKRLHRLGGHNGGVTGVACGEKGRKKNGAEKPVVAGLVRSIREMLPPQGSPLLRPSQCGVNPGHHVVPMLPKSHTRTAWL